MKFKYYHSKSISLFRDIYYILLKVTFIDEQVRTHKEEFRKFDASTCGQKHCNVGIYDAALIKGITF